MAFIALNLISACTSSNDNTTTAKKTTFEAPFSLQKLSDAGGILNAYVIIDGDESNRIPMTLNREGQGAAAVTIPDLSRTLHTIIVTYEYTSTNGVITLATAGRPANLSTGSITVDISANEYDLNTYDEDGDGTNNAQELLDGRDPFTIEVAMAISTAIPALSTAASAAGTLRAFITLDGDNENRVEMNIDTVAGSANYTFPGLLQTQHGIVINFEYTDTEGTITLITANRNIDLTNGPVTLDADVNNTDIVLFDEDNDGITNINELLAGSNPRASVPPAAAAVATLTYEQTKTFRFTWKDVPDATYYQLRERIETNSNLDTISNQISPATQTFQHIVPLYSRINAQYILQSCNSAGCVDSDSIFIDSSKLVDSIGYFKSDEIISLSTFGNSVGLSGDGKTLAVGAQDENSVGKVHIFTRQNKKWVQQAVLRASNGHPPIIRGNSGDLFGGTSLSNDGNILAISAQRESSSSTGISTIGSSDNSLPNSGAVYIFIRNGELWSEQAYIKASNTGENDLFGSSFSLSADGKTLAVGAVGEDSDSTGVNSAQNNDNASASGAVYIFTQNSAGWQQRSYIKASNTAIGDSFGGNVSLSGDGKTLAVGATREDGLTNSQANEGAVYIFISSAQNSNIWTQQQYLKPNTIDAGDRFGASTSLSFDGNTLVVSSPNEASATQDDPSNNDNNASGAAYVFTREINNWNQQAYLKAINSSAGDFLGEVSINNTGDMFVASSIGENTNAVGINGSGSAFATRGLLSSSGAAYVFSFNGTQWLQQAFLKASNTQETAGFGSSIISRNGKAIAISALYETSPAIGVNGPQTGIPSNSGAVYLY